MMNYMCTNKIAPSIICSIRLMGKCEWFNVG